MNGADAIIKCLEAEDVKVVFGYPGVAICPFITVSYSLILKPCWCARNRMQPMPQAEWQE